jgi:serine/threonine protein kinase
LGQAAQVWSPCIPPDRTEKHAGSPLALPIWPRSSSICLVARFCPDAACGKKYPDNIAFCGECGKITIQEQPPDDIDPRLGQRLGSYLVVARIADGAMGRVYEGRHHETKARVAIKVLHAEVARDAVAVERFKREYETASEMKHPNVVKVIEFGATEDRSQFMTMEYLEGEELGNLLRRGGKVETPRLLRIVCQIALALDYAHSFGFIHRDLKPDNIFLCRGEGGETVRILDFGSVKLQMDTGPKLTAFGTTLGSPYYMSPEQAMGKQDVDQRTDVFALAAITYEALTGKIAFEAINVAQILMKIINQNPTPPSQLAQLPGSVDDVIDKGLRKDKTKRYSDASSLAAGLCQAFGLSADAKHWAEASTSEIAAQLSSAQPPAAKAFGAQSEAPPPSRNAPQSLAPGGISVSSIPGMAANPSMKVGIAVAALAVVALVTVLLLR